MSEETAVLVRCRYGKRQNTDEVQKNVRNLWNDLYYNSLSNGKREVRRIQSNILNGYDTDFSKHAPHDQVQRIRMVWKSIPSQLFKENKKFVYGVLRNGARAKDFEIAIQWLISAGLVYKVPRCNKLRLPLGIYEDMNAFKMYFLDIGLLGAMVKTEPAHILVKNDALPNTREG